ncbi:cytochrome b [Chiayiivirga flava]|uniref:Cytochrome b561 n=1 Tax=Chiayiivirga flava TaxID=659595 RepID=A0A7W8D7M9_9GAMM|nr:cytochrome b [Chiayiivirga flava]MBB5209441.1 cytochrome b561 [Chiayiivirga flava]
MTLRNTDQRWGWVSQALHWTIAVLILGMAVLGFLLDEVPKSPKYFWVFDLHKSTGLTVLALMLVRLGWRLWAGAPRPVPGTPTWQEWIARLTHWAIYAMAFLMPISGWLYDSASGLRALTWFGLFTVPKLAAPDRDLRGLAHDMHETGIWILLALLAAHIGAALYHHFVVRDRTLVRMLPASFEPKPRDPAA